MSKLLSIFRSAKQAAGVQGYAEAIPALQVLLCFQINVLFNAFFCRSQRLGAVLQGQLRHWSATTATPTEEPGKETVAEDPLGHATGLER